MATGNDSLKTKDFRLNPKAGLCYSENGNSVALTGEVEVITDAEIKKELWQEWFIAHFPLGPADPNYVLLKFKGQKATIWIDGVLDVYKRQLQADISRRIARLSKKCRAQL